MDECKELESVLNDTKQRLKEIENKMNRIDPSRYLEWNSSDLVSWICSLDNGRYCQYKDKLLSAFRQQGVDGKSIHYLDYKIE